MVRKDEDCNETFLAHEHQEEVPMLSWAVSKPATRGRWRGLCLGLMGDPVAPHQGAAEGPPPRASWGFIPHFGFF